MSPKAEWVFMGPDPHLAHCKRCGKTIPQPELPTPIDAYVAYLEYVVAAHRDCRVAVEVGSNG